MYQSCFKRLLDLILSLAACVILAIPMGIIAIWIKMDSPGPVFFRQRQKTLSLNILVKLAMPTLFRRGSRPFQSRVDSSKV